MVQVQVVGGIVLKPFMCSCFNLVDKSDERAAFLGGVHCYSPKIYRVKIGNIQQTSSHTCWLWQIERLGALPVRVKDTTTCILVMTVFIGEVRVFHSAVHAYDLVV